SIHQSSVRGQSALIPAPVPADQTQVEVVANACRLIRLDYAAHHTIPPDAGGTERLIRIRDLNPGSHPLRARKYQHAAPPSVAADPCQLRPRRAHTHDNDEAPPRVTPAPARRAGPQLLALAPISRILPIEGKRVLGY